MITMKKSYIIPTLQIVKIEQTQPIAGSGSLNTSGATFYDDDATGEALVKGRTQHYDVWEDDWSEENDE